MNEQLGIAEYNGRSYAVKGEIALLSQLLNISPEVMLDTSGSHWAVFSYKCLRCPDRHTLILASWGGAFCLDEAEEKQEAKLTPCDSRAIAEALFDKLSTGGHCNG